ncbi:MAG: 50S ribosomal protein L31 [Akkermansia sp.]
MSTSTGRFRDPFHHPFPKTEVIDGLAFASCGITSDSHPFFTGKNQFVDTEGRIDKFQKRFGSSASGGKPKLSK